MDKSIDYYMNLPYTIEMQRDPEAGWFVRVKELPGCMSQGDTAEEALAMIWDAMRAWLEVALQEKVPIPEPKPEEEYSGKFVVRVPRSLHRELVEAADEEGVSLNQFINVVLAKATGRQVVSAHPQEKREVYWPGLDAAVARVLQSAGLRQEAGELDEQLVANWLGRTLEQVDRALQQGACQEAVSYIDSLAYGLRAGLDKSPLMMILYRLLGLLQQQIEVTAKLQQGVINDMLMRLRISNLVGEATYPIVQMLIRDERAEYSSISTEPMSAGVRGRLPDVIRPWARTRQW